PGSYVDQNRLVVQPDRCEIVFSTTPEDFSGFGLFKPYDVQIVSLKDGSATSLQLPMAVSYFSGVALDRYGGYFYAVSVGTSQSLIRRPRNSNVVDVLAEFGDPLSGFAVSDLK